MQFSKTTCFAQAQLRPTLCIWSIMSPAARTSPAAPLPAPATPSHTGQPGGQRICMPSPGAGLGTDPAEKRLLYPAHSQRLAPIRCGAAQGLNKGQRWAIPARARAKVVRVQLHLAAALPKRDKSRAVTSSNSYAFCFSYHCVRLLP